MAAKTYDVREDELEAMDRTALLDVIATDIVARRGATSRRRSEKSDQVRVMELQIELKKWSWNRDDLTQRQKTDKWRYRMNAKSGSMS